MRVVQKRRLEDKVWKVGNMAMKIMELVVYNVAYLRTKWHHDPSSRLATIDMGRELGWGAVPIFRGSWIPIQHYHLGPGLPPYQVAS